jgi:hypothetical protein
MNQAKAAVVTMPGGHAVLFEVNRKKADVKPSRPFGGRMEDNSWDRYKDVFRRLLSFVRRTSARRKAGRRSS